MRREIEKYELIERYLTRQLPHAERLDFEERMGKDADFAKEVANQQEIMDFIDDASMLSVKESLGSIHQKYAGKPGSVNGYNWFWTIPAILIIATISLFFKKNEAPQDNEPLPKVKLTEVTELKKDNNIPIIQDTGQLIVSNKKETKLPEKHTTHPVNQNLPLPLGHETKNSDSVSQQEKAIFLPAVLNSSESSSIKNNRDKPVETNPETGLPEEDTIAPPEKFDCSNTLIDAEVQTDKSCSEKPTGSIFVDAENIRGGTPPYSLSIGNNGEFSLLLKFENLISAFYSVHIRDKNNCNSYLGSYYIESFDCTYEQVFAPDKGEVWEIPEQESPSQLKIFNKASQLIYQCGLEPGIRHEWNGRTESGSELPMGAYPFVIAPENKEPFWGTITIVR